VILWIEIAIDAAILMRFAERRSDVEIGQGEGLAKQVGRARERPVQDPQCTDAFAACDLGAHRIARQAGNVALAPVDLGLPPQAPLIELGALLRSSARGDR
jgi:hypothetical protein